MTPDMFAGWDRFFKMVTVLLFVGVPLALWKLVEIAVWAYNHIQIGIK